MTEPTRGEQTTHRVRELLDRATRLRQRQVRAVEHRVASLGERLGERPSVHVGMQVGMLERLALRRTS